MLRESASLVLEENELLKMEQKAAEARLDALQTEAGVKINNLEDEAAFLKAENSKLKHMTRYSHQRNEGRNGLPNGLRANFTKRPRLRHSSRLPE